MAADASIFKAYDIRGVYPAQIDEAGAYAIAQGYVDYVKPNGEVLVGRDVRLHSEALQKQVIAGLVDAGVNVVDVGLIMTDMSYFGVGSMKLAGGIQVTASHNPAEWHGFKMVKAEAAPLTGEEGISQIRAFVESGKKIEATKKGTVRQVSLWDDYCDYVLKWIDVSAIKPMKVVTNANFGPAGRVFELLVARGGLPIEIVPLNCELDGSFPKGRPDPFIPENRTEISELVKSSGAQLGIAWDADADRVFFCADGGVFVDSYYLNTLLIQALLKKNPGSTVIYDPRYTWATLDTVAANGGVVLPSRVGHSYIKQAMREHNGLFSGESSGHTYFRDFWFADSGMIPAVLVLEHLSVSGKKLSEEMKPVMEKYIISGEINQKVEKPTVVMETLKTKYADAQISTLDGITIEYPEFRFNVRSSNTEPLLRLNLEAKSQSVMEQKRDEVLALMKSVV